MALCIVKLFKSFHIFRMRKSKRFSFFNSNNYGIWCPDENNKNYGFWSISLDNFIKHFKLLFLKDDVLSYTYLYTNITPIIIKTDFQQVLKIVARKVSFRLPKHSQFTSERKNVNDVKFHKNLYYLSITKYTEKRHGDF